MSGVRFKTDKGVAVVIVDKNGNDRIDPEDTIQVGSAAAMTADHFQNNDRIMKALRDLGIFKPNLLGVDLRPLRDYVEERQHFKESARKGYGPKMEASYELMVKMAEKVGLKKDEIGRELWPLKREGYKKAYWNVIRHYKVAAAEGEDEIAAHYEHLAFEYGGKIGFNDQKIEDDLVKFGKIAEVKPWER